MFDLRGTLRRNDVGEYLRDQYSKGHLFKNIPELRELDLQNSRHKDVFEHSIKVLENARDMMDKKDDVLLVAALFHDIGKKTTRKFEKKLVTFKAHDVVGARMVKKFLPKYGYSKSEVNQVSTLVALHMRGHTFKEANWGDSAVRRLVKDSGSIKQFERLIILSSADITTKKVTRRDQFRKAAQDLRDAALVILEEDAKKARRPALNGRDVMTLLGLDSGPELGKIMKFLNSEEGLALTAAEAKKIVVKKFKN